MLQQWMGTEKTGKNTPVHLSAEHLCPEHMRHTHCKLQRILFTVAEN